MEKLPAFSGNYPSAEAPAMVNPLVLAYLGDTLYDLYVRTRLVSDSRMPAGRLHKQAIRYVCAAGQAHALERLSDSLTEEEAGVVRRGRNAKSPTVPKNATVADYRKATAFETLLGYLYLSGKMERAEELMTKAFALIEEEEYHATGRTPGEIVMPYRRSR